MAYITFKVEYNTWKKSLKLTCSKLLDYKRYNDKETVHMSIKQNICSLGKN